MFSYRGIVGWFSGLVGRELEPILALLHPLWGGFLTLGKSFLPGLNFPMYSMSGQFSYLLGPFPCLPSPLSSEKERKDNNNGDLN